MRALMLIRAFRVRGHLDVKRLGRDLEPEPPGQTVRGRDLPLRGAHPEDAGLDQDHLRVVLDAEQAILLGAETRRDRRSLQAGLLCPCAGACESADAGHEQARDDGKPGVRQAGFPVVDDGLQVAGRRRSNAEILP